MTISSPHIVIIGAGAGGLLLATRLGNQLGKQQKAHITLINPGLTYVWKPLWHEVAAGTLSSQEDELNLVAHAHHHGFRFLLGSLQGIDRKQRKIFLAPIVSDSGEVLLEQRYLHYSLLVIAIGSITADFNIPGVKEHCFQLNCLSEARNFQQQFLTQFITSQNPQKPERVEPLRIAIVGAGATGIELASELYEAAEQASEYNWAKTEDENVVEISLIEASPTILKGLPEKVIERVMHNLEQKGIRIYLNTQVSHVSEAGFHIGTQLVPAELKVWAAGIKAPDVLQQLDGLEVNRLNQLIVKSTLQTIVDENIFAIGDCAACQQTNSDLPVPPRAQAAQQQALTLASSLINHIHNKPLLNYVYRDYGTLISLSQRKVLGNLKIPRDKNHFFSGYLAYISYRFLYRRYQAVLHGWWRVSLLIIANWLSKSVRPRLKLH